MNNWHKLISRKIFWNFYLSQPINAREEELKANRTSPMTIYKKRKQVLLLVIGAAPDEGRKYLLIASYLIFPNFTYKSDISDSSCFIISTGYFLSSVATLIWRHLSSSDTFVHIFNQFNIFTTASLYNHQYAGLASASIPNYETEHQPQQSYPYNYSYQTASHYR